MSSIQFRQEGQVAWLILNRPEVFNSFNRGMALELHCAGPFSAPAAPMLEGCLACHGSDIEPQTAAAIRALYPDDEAVGFAVGDLRGAFSLTRTVDAVEFEEPRPPATAGRIAAPGRSATSSARASSSRGSRPRDPGAPWDD